LYYAIVAEALGFPYETLFKSADGTVIGEVVSLSKKMEAKK